jgi:hypothetical protein
MLVLEVMAVGVLSSKSLQKATKPEAIFSGHDHVGCVYRHNAHTTEYTLRAIQAEYWGYTGVYVPPNQVSRLVEIARMERRDAL